MKRFVLVTRHPADCAELQSYLEPAGMVVRPYPVLRLADVADHEGWRAARRAVAETAAASWVVLASPRAPERFVAGCRRLEAKELLELPAAAVGDDTAAAARAAGLRVELVGPGTGAGLAEQLLARLGPGATVVFACGRDRRPELPGLLEAAGHRVLPVVVYRMDPTPPRELPPLGPSLHAVVLTSPRAAELYLRGVGGLPLPVPHLALGPTTRRAAAVLGIECREPAEPTMKSLAEELCRI